MLLKDDDNEEEEEEKLTFDQYVKSNKNVGKMLPGLYI
jgi:hypothetical protein